MLLFWHLAQNRVLLFWRLAPEVATVYPVVRLNINWSWRSEEEVKGQLVGGAVNVQLCCILLIPHQRAGFSSSSSFLRKNVGFSLTLLVLKVPPTDSDVEVVGSGLSTNTNVKTAVAQTPQNATQTFTLMQMMY